MKIFLNAIKYDNYQENICGDFRIIGMLIV